MAQMLCSVPNATTIQNMIRRPAVSRILNILSKPVFTISQTALNWPDVKVPEIYADSGWRCRATTSDITILNGIKRDGGYTEANAQAFSDMMKEQLGWETYGDTTYPEHVLRYYK